MAVNLHREPPQQWLVDMNPRNDVHPRASNHIFVSIWEPFFGPPDPPKGSPPLMELISYDHNISFGDILLKGSPPKYLQHIRN